VLGTPYYMSPEQLRGKQSVDARSDIYSFGVILYELLAGHLPFRQDNIGDLMVAITVTGAPSLAVLRPELGQKLSDVVARAMHPAPEKRYADARELRKALLELLPSLPLQAMCVIQNIVDTHPGRGEPLEWAEPMPAETRQAPLALMSLPVTRFSWSTRVRRSATLVAAAGVALLVWLAIHQLTTGRELGTEPVHAGIDRRIQARAVNSRFTLSPLEVIDIKPRAAPSVAEDTIDAPPLAAIPVPDNNSESPKVSAADQPAAAPKHARERVRAREAKARTSSSDRPQRLYKKLDF
jgi:hypothetical protein